VIIGHVRLKHLHKMGLLLDRTCAACGIEEESALHFICVCSTLSNLRTHIFGKPANMRRGRLAFLCNLQKRVVDLRLVFNKTSIIGCTLVARVQRLFITSPINNPSIHPSKTLHYYILRFICGHYL
jgi:hypothetical protein